ncbi:MAG: LPS export ABC transporter ATP-binding protein [Planctomycetes bacterium]|nr:LPS export ABC transporter ATP-binding protein [Planctomycetota bacterium]
MTLLATESLRKRYGAKTVVQDVSVGVGAGEVVGLLGPNGAGKTTTFAMVMGLIRPDGGRIVFDGDDVTGLPVSERARRGMGYLSQEPSVFKRLSVRDNVLAVLEWIPGMSRGVRIDRMARILEDLDLSRLGDRRAQDLSGGERRRLEIARILVTEPKLVLLDEPFSGVDPIAIEEIQKLIIGLRERGIGILVTDHNVRDMLTITNRSYIIHEGRILQHGTARQLIDDERVRRTYLGERFVMPELGSAAEELPKNGA